MAAKDIVAPCRIKRVKIDLFLGSCPAARVFT